MLIKANIIKPLHVKNNNFGFQTGPEVIKLFSSSAPLSMKFQLLIDVVIVIISGKFRFKTKKLVAF